MIGELPLVSELAVVLVDGGNCIGLFLPIYILVVL